MDDFALNALYAQRVSVTGTKVDKDKIQHVKGGYCEQEWNIDLFPENNPN